MKEQSLESTTVRPAPLSGWRVSWGAIFAGLAVGLVIQMVLTIFGVGIGASTIEPTHMDSGTAKSFGLGAAIWFGLTSIISTFCGAWVAGRFSGGPRRTDGMVHGVTTWAAATLLTAFLLSTAVGSLLGGTAKLLGQTMSAGGQAASAGGVDMQNLLQQAQSMIGGGGQPGLSPTGRETSSLPSEVQKDPQLAAIIARMFSKGGAAADPQDRQQAISFLVSKGMGQEQAASTVDNWDRQYQQTKQNVKEKAGQAGEAIATGTAKAAWGAFVMLVLCGLAAAWGGWLGTIRTPYLRTESAATA